MAIIQEACSDIGQIKKKFVHLHLHTTYSLLDGAQLVGDLKSPKKEYGVLNLAQKLGMDAIAITDHGNMFGAIDFFKKAKSGGVKPLVGCETYIAPYEAQNKESHRLTGRTAYHLLLLCMNNEGYKNLSHLVTYGHFEGFYYRPRIDKAMLRKHAKGLIGTSSCLAGEICQHLIKGRDEEALAIAKEYAEIFEGRFYIELQKNGLELQEQMNPKLVKIARELGLGLVATNDVHYMTQEDAEAQDALMAIQTRKSLSDPTRLKHEVQEFYLKSPEQMWELFADYPEACENTVKIAEMCDVDILPKGYFFPRLETAAGMTNDDALAKEAQEGMEARLATLLPRKPPEKHQEIRANYQERLDYELRVVKQMGFADYFRIVADFINWAKNNDIPVGPGRGSAAGSLVAYSTRITDVDPIEHDLLFERFLNPERVSMPDIDVDFCEAQREKVIEYVRQRYAVPGGPAVSQIITFGKLKAKAVLKDVGRAMDMSFAETDRLAKLIPNVLNITLDEAIRQEPRLQQEIKNSPQVAKLFDIAKRLEGLNRHASVHAAGVVISDGRPLVEHLPLYKGSNDEVVTQFDMKGVETIGLIKFDFLGLKNLTLIKHCLEMVEKNRGQKILLDQIELEDKEVFKLLCAADTLGVFQLESSGMRQLITRLRPSCFEDVIALVALYRPGPLKSGMADSFIRRKHGEEEIDFIFDVLEPVLKSTYGVCIYQEQVMQIANILASYSLGEADLLRRAMGKKDAAEMERQRGRFLEGSEKNQHDREKAADLFGKVEKFAEYGFNRCLVPETRIMDAQRGEWTTIGDLYERPRPFFIHALGEDWRLRSRRVVDVIANGEKPVFTIKTRLGNTITATGNHPFRTLEGWTLLEDLKEGDRIAAPRHLPHQETQPTNNRENIFFPSQQQLRDELLPSILSERIEEKRCALGMTWDEIEKRCGMTLRGFFHDPHQKKEGLRRDIAHLIGETLADPTLQQITTSDVYWDTIVSITPQGMRETFDLTVENDHNFVAEGLFVHNSHSAAYGLIAYQTAWLKAHYRHEYMAALLTADAGNSDKILLYLNDCRQHHVEVLPPDVNESSSGFAVIGEKIRFALAGIKGIGDEAIKSILDAREKEGAFTDLYNFCKRVDLKRVNRRVIEALIKCGAFDSLGHNRASLIAVVEDAIQYGQRLQKEKDSQQISLFMVMAEAPVEQAPIIPKLNEWSEKERLQHEKETLGFYISGHPLRRFEKDLKRFSSNTIADLEDSANNAEATIAGIVTTKRDMTTKKGDRMAFVTIEDMTGSIEISVFPRVFSACAALLESEEPLLVRGLIERDENQIRMRADEIRSLVAARNEKAKEVHLHLDATSLSDLTTRKMFDIFQKNQGSCTTFIHLTIPRRSETLLRLAEEIKVEPTEAFEEAIESLFGPRVISLR
jgi:DNA polymerase-3 subunit alpha